MSNGVKVLLIVLGSFVALIALVVSVFVFVIVPKAVANFKTDQNPAGQRKLASSIANFDVPPGYKQTLGANLFFMKVLTIVPVDRTRHFTIIMEGINIPTASTEQQGPALEQGMKRGLSGQCKNPVTSAEETIHAKTQSISLHVFKCGDAGSNVEMALALFPGTSNLVTVTATGSGSDFDLVAVRRLLASVR